MKALQWGTGELLLAGLALVALAGVVQPASAQTLEDAIRQALRANEEVLSASRSRDASDQDLRQARAGYLPLVDIRAGSGYQWSDNSNTVVTTPTGTRGSTRGLQRTESQLTARQLLWDFGGV